MENNIITAQEPARRNRCHRENFIATFTTCGFSVAVNVAGASMDAVNDYVVRHFDVVPGAPFAVTTVPAVAVLPDAPRMFTCHAPSQDAVTRIIHAAGVHISDANMKMGAIPSLSLAPGRTCSADARRTCFVDGCYACKSYRCRPTVRGAWDANTDAARGGLGGLRYGVALYLRTFRPRFFRFHVGGDFVSRDYVAAAIDIATWFPGVKFLAFTKQFNHVRGFTFPANFTIRLSDWPGTVVPADLRRLYHVAWCDDGTRPADTFPADALECPGNCETCGACWDVDRDTIFHKH